MVPDHAEARVRYIGPAVARAVAAPPMAPPYIPLLLIADTNRTFTSDCFPCVSLCRSGLSSLALWYDAPNVDPERARCWLLGDLRACLHASPSFTLTPCSLRPNSLPHIAECETPVCMSPPRSWSSYSPSPSSSSTSGLFRPLADSEL